MRHGIVILPELRWSQAAGYWQRAEAYGFDHAWTYDHLGWRDLVDGPWFDAVPTLTAAATVTARVRLGTLVASANFRHPVAFAREIVTLDDVSGGRLLLGLGAGGTGFDADVLGQAKLTGGERIDRFVEFVELLQRLLREGRADFRGEWYSAVDARATPGSQAPFVIAGNAPRSIGLAARLGDGWITTGERTDDVDTWWRSIADRCVRLEEALDGRVIDRYLLLDSGPGEPLASHDAYAEFCGRAAALGFTDVISHWPRRDGWFAGDESVLDGLL
ncbi:MAG: hypothetical protein QOI80_1198 [Solirubrobacteraceae bacterium]|nr:hypothetical protein [Solirubrobacteraceae bacterium]